MASWLFVLAAYLIGSVSFAVVVSKLFALPDPHSYGSGNPGATNVLRTGNRWMALATLLLDAGKGIAAVLIARYFLTAGADTPLAASFIVYGAGIGAFFGHVFPVWLGFKGGKGVATALGVLLGYSWVLGLAVAASWLIVAVFFRYSSLASLVAAVFAPVYYLFGDGVAWYMNKGVLLATGVMSLLLLYRHAENIGRLAKGTESRLGKKTSPPVAEPEPAPHPRHPGPGPANRDQEPF